MACATDVQVRRSRPPSPRFNGKQTGPSVEAIPKCSPGVAGGRKPEHSVRSGSAGYSICTASRRGLTIAPAATAFSHVRQPSRRVRAGE
jgi:hypothetical protein